jgi:SsrA-binding protein
MAGKKGAHSGDVHKGGDRMISNNRKAYHDYFIDETLEVGVVLVGSEIKSIRAGQVNLRDSYVTIRDGEAWMIGSHIAGYQEASYQDHDPRRDRKLLLHRRQIERWLGKAEQKGYTIVPLKLYLKKNRAKVEIGLARGKRTYDKRETVAKRTADLAMRRAVKEARGGNDAD